MQIKPQKHTQTPRPTLNGIWFSDDILFDLEELYDWRGNLPRLTGGIDGFKLLIKQTTYWRAIIYYPGVSISEGTKNSIEREAGYVTWPYTKKIEFIINHANVCQ